MKFFKKAIAGVLTATMLLGCMVTASAATSSPTSAPVPSNQTNVTASVPTASDQTGVEAKNLDNVLVVSTSKDATATLTKAPVKSKVAVPSKVEVSGVTYTIVAIGAKAFSTEVTTIKIPASVKTIKATAFTGAKNLKKIVLKGKTLKVEKKAFKGLNTKKITIKISKKLNAKQVKKLTKQLKKAGFKGKIKK